MGIAATEKELAGKAARFLKAEMKRAGVTYAELARRLEGHGLDRRRRRRSPASWRGGRSPLLSC